MDAKMADTMTFLQTEGAKHWQQLLTKVQRFEFGIGLNTMLTSTDKHLNFDLFLSWTIVFLVLYLLFALIWKMLPNSGLSQKKLPFVASSRCIGTVHFCFVVPLSAMCLNLHNPNWLKIDYVAPNFALEQRLIELSVGYFTADFIHFLIFEPDVLFFFHHVFSILMMGSAGVIGRGGTSACAALFMGEITNPFQSSWTVARVAKSERLLKWLSPLFTFVFIAVRVPIVPYWTANIILNYWNSPHKSSMPTGILEAWGIMAAFMAIGGWLWSYSLIKGFMKYRRVKKQDTKKEDTKKTK